MHRRSLGLVVALASSALALGAAPATVMAECMSRPVPEAYTSIASAFTATVEDISTEVDQAYKDAGEGDGVIWHIDLRVDHVYRGTVPARLSLTGHSLEHASCSYFRGERTKVGQTLFVALDDQIDLASNEDLHGNLLLWRRVGDRWSFHTGALKNGRDPDLYLPAARDAHTTRQILAAIAGVAPSTDTVPEASSQTRPSRDAVPWIWVLGAVFAISFVANLRSLAGARGRGVRTE